MTLNTKDNYMNKSGSSKLCQKSNIELILEKQRIEFSKETSNKENIYQL